MSSLRSFLSKNAGGSQSGIPGYDRMVVTAAAMTTGITDLQDGFVVKDENISSYRQKTIV